MRLFGNLINFLNSGRDKVILSDEYGEYGIREIWEFSGRVYRYLMEHGIGREDVVMVLLPRDAKAVMVAVGVWRAGAAVTIHESWTSSDWIDYVKRDTACRLVIDDALLEQILAFEPLEGWVEPDPHDLAYITYTTGSTGERKGVMQEYGIFEKTYRIFEKSPEGWPSAEDYRSSLVISLHSAIPLIVYSIYFCSYFDIVPREVIAEWSLFRQRLIDKQITYTCDSPVFLAERDYSNLPHIECIGTSFEPVTDMYSSDIPLVNEYGMTEAGGVVSEFPIDRFYEITPIGKPYFSDETFLLDQEGNRVKDGEVGEICFVNHYCRGYLNMPEATAAQFVDGIFHTRDLGKVLPDGNWVMLGRMNDSIETEHGLIVAIGIEAIAREVLGYRNVYAKVFAGEQDPVICIYSDIDIDLGSLREKMRVHLPEYKLPTDFVRIDSFHRRNGKVIRLELRNPYE